MKLGIDEKNELCNIAKEAAIKAGTIIQKATKESFQVKTKVGGENIASQVVTEIDLEAQETILKVLKDSQEKYDIGLLAEESNDNGSRFEKDYFWCIDPLDGTLAFSRDEEGYSVSIALISKEGIPTIGVVYNPREDVLYSAIRGKGAFRNKDSFKVKNNNDFLTLLYDQSFLKIKNYEEEIENLEVLAKELGLKGVKNHHLGGAVMNGICTIELSPAVYYKHPKKALGGGSIWDFAASSVIQSEAGGLNSNFYGKPLDLNRADSTFMNHEGVFYRSHDGLKIKSMP